MMSVLERVDCKMTTGDKGKLYIDLHSFLSFIYSLPAQQDCVLADPWASLWPGPHPLESGYQAVNTCLIMN